MLILGAVGLQIRLSGSELTLLNLSHLWINTGYCYTLHEKILCFGKVFVYLQQNLELCRNTLITLNR